MDTTIENVKSQLMYEWDEERNDEGDYVLVKGRQLMSEEEANAMIQRHMDVFEEGKLLRSFAYYTAGQIRKADKQS